MSQTAYVPDLQTEDAVYPCTDPLMTPLKVCGTVSLDDSASGGTGRVQGFDNVGDDPTADPILVAGVSDSGGVGVVTLDEDGNIHVVLPPATESDLMALRVCACDTASAIADTNLLITGGNSSLATIVTSLSDVGTGIINQTDSLLAPPENYTTITALSDTVVNVSADAAYLRGWNFINENVSAVYVKLFNADAGDVTLGADTPELIYKVPGGGEFYQEVTSVRQHFFGTALSAVCVTGLADVSTTAPASGIYAQFSY